MLQSGVDGDVGGANHWDLVGEVSAVGASDSEDVGLGLNGGWDHERGEEVSEAAVVVDEVRDIEVVTEGSLSSGLEPAVVTESHEAAVSEEDQPSVNWEGEELVDESLDPSENSEWKEGQVEDPDEDSGDLLGDETNSEEEEVIDEVVDSSDKSEERPPWEGCHADDTDLDDVSSNNEGECNEAWEKSFHNRGVVN